MTRYKLPKNNGIPTLFQDRLDLLRLQRSKETCGIAAFKNAFALSLGYGINEKDLWQLTSQIYESLGKPDTPIEEWIGPKPLAMLIKNVGKECLDQNLKVFATREGTLEHLAYLLDKGIAPIIHRRLHEDLDSNFHSEFHYEIVLGVDKSVYMFNSAWYQDTKGLNHLPKKDFMESWWPNGKMGNETWFMAFFPEDIVLPKSKFNGKYL